jgi:nucleotide-binding universal stress UspA family protein
MVPFHKILAPTDFSEPANNGVEAAKLLAQRDGAECVLIHVVAPVRMIPPSGPPAHSGLEMSTVMQELEEGAQSTLEETAAKLKEEGVQARSMVVRGIPAEEIAAAAEEEKADVVVIATHGWTGWRRFVFGSVAEKVVRLSPCPVLTIPSPVEKG